jgi:hypothetical protein
MKVLSASQCLLVGWPGRAQRLICWSAAGEALRKAQGACDAHISEDAGYHHDDRGGPRQKHVPLVGLDRRGAVVLQQKVTRGQLERRLANIPRCLIGMEACSGSHHIGRRLAALGHDVRLIPAQYVKPFLKGHKNDYRDAFPPHGLVHRRRDCAALRSVGLDDLIRALLVSNDLGNAVVIALHRPRCDYNVSLKTLKLAGAAREFALVGSARHEVALFEDLVACVVSVGAEAVRLHCLGRWIDDAAELTATTHVVQDGISFVVGRSHGHVHHHIFLATPDRHRFGRGYLGRCKGD